MEKIQSQHKVCGYSFCQILPAFSDRVGSLSGVEPQVWLWLDGKTDCWIFFLMELCSFFQSSALMFELVAVITLCTELFE